MGYRRWSGQGGRGGGRGRRVDTGPRFENRGCRGRTWPRPGPDPARRPRTCATRPRHARHTPATRPRHVFFFPPPFFPPPFFFSPFFFFTPPLFFSPPFFPPLFFSPPLFFPPFFFLPLFSFFFFCSPFFSKIHELIGWVGCCRAGGLGGVGWVLSRLIGDLSYSIYIYMSPIPLGSI